ncbi:unnamed protein product [Somion occarium]|uniref:Uncharacterized protein n=1 Tax=Somion occarium TaxID=3059160 RepID=A0ABP1D0Z8_9APHY
MVSSNADAESSNTSTSSLARHVRHAIQTAIEMEAMDKVIPGEVKDSSSSPSQTPTRPSAPVPEDSPSTPPAVNVPSMQPSSAPTGRQPSKLAMLAQTKAQSYWMPKPKKPPAPQVGITLREARTEYLTPIANGPTATTAITTSYRSLSDLSRLPRLPPSFPPHVRPSESPRHAATKEPKQSKLAMKSKKAHMRAELEPESEMVEPVPELTIFAAASPRSQSKHKRKESKGRERQANGGTHRHRTRPSVDPTVPLSPLQGFAFDIPSPDDIVFRARQGTSLAPRSSTTASRHSSSTSTTTSSSSTSSSTSTSKSTSSSTSTVSPRPSKLRSSVKASG